MTDSLSTNTGSGANTETVDTSMLAAVRLALRRSGTAFDSEIADLISAARTTLEGAGIATEKAYSDSDALIRLFVCTFSKAHFGLENTDSEKYKASYEQILATMQGRTDYLEETGT